MLKKILIGSIIFFILAAGITSYLIFFKKSSNTPVIPASDNPFGDLSGNTNLQNTGNDTSGGPTINKTIQIQTLTRITTEPVAGALVLQNATSSIIRYNERSTSHVHDVNLFTGTSSTVSNTTIPKVYESLWFLNGNNVILRYPTPNQDSITSYLAELSQTATTSATSTVQKLRELHGRFLPADVSSAALSPDGKQAFIFIEDSNGSSGAIINAQGENSTTVFTSPLREWITSWPSTNTLTITTKAASGHLGYLFFVNPKNGVQTKIMGNIYGLTTATNPDASLVAFSNDTNALQIYDIKTGVTSPSNLNTLAEKCVWSKKSPTIMFCAVPNFIPSGSYPDSWYKGKVLFSDTIYKIDTKLKNFVQVANLEAMAGQAIDVIDPLLSSNEDTLIFKNKNDYSLWSLKLSR